MGKQNATSVTIMAWPNMAISMARRNMALSMAIIGYPAKNWQNIHNIQKQIAKYQLKSYAQTKIFC